MKHQIDIQGHRGCRGLMPENTIPAFLKALDLGVNTLEMDVVVSKDSQLIVSHEPFFNHEISTNLASEIEITESNEKEFNIYNMSLSDIQKIDVGQKIHPRFPDQLKLDCVKPTLDEVVSTAEAYIEEKNLPKVYYNIEIKHVPESDNEFHPTAEVFTSLTYQKIKSLGILDRTIIQSFDPECLNILHKIDSTVVTALLVENIMGLASNLGKLDYTPSIYSPYFKLVSSDMIETCDAKNIKVIPWTINDEKDIKEMIYLGVDGIISDFPDRVISIKNQLTTQK